MTKYFCDGCGAEVPESEVWGDEGAVVDSERIKVGKLKHEVHLSMYVANHDVLCGKCVCEAVEKALTLRYGKAVADGCSGTAAHQLRSGGSYGQ